MAEIKNVASGAVYTVSGDPQWIGGVWECGDRRFTDMTGEAYQIVSLNYAPNVVSIGVFLSSITALELAGLRASTDPLVQQFVLLCDDPRITAIDLNLPRIQFDINYAAGLVAAPAGAANAGQMLASPPIGGAARAAAILAGDPLAATS